MEPHDASSPVDVDAKRAKHFGGLSWRGAWYPLALLEIRMVCVNTAVIPDARNIASRGRSCRAEL
jgi:hypothetical protein